MKSKLITTTLLTLSALAALPASAQSIKPGLWQVTSTTPTGNVGNTRITPEHMALAKDLLASMPAEQRKQMESAMANAGAGDMQLTDNGVTLKQCISKEQAADYSSLIIREGNCTVQRTPAVAGVAKFDMRCTNPQATGNGTVRFQGDTGYALDMTTTANINGQSMTNKISATGKWLGADCGSIKPVARAK